MKKMGSIGYGLTSLLVLLALTLSVVSCAGNNLQPALPQANLAADAQQYDLIFAVAGDSRSAVSYINPDDKGSPPFAGYINTMVQDEMRNYLINYGKGLPGFFFMHLGDFAMRGGTEIFQTYMLEMASLQNAGIPVYATIGNHELRYYEPKETHDAESDANTLKAQQQYQATIGKSKMIPSDAQFPQDYEGGLAYYFRRETPGGSSVFIVLDAFYVNHDNPKEPNYKKGYYSDFQLKWLQDTLIYYQTHGNVKNIFVFSHQPAYDANAGDGRFYTNYNSPDSNRANWILWALLDKYQVDAYFCGHSHFYHRWFIRGGTPSDAGGKPFEYLWDKTGDAKWRSLGSDFNTSNLSNIKDNKLTWQTVIPQIVNGSCGAGLQGFGGNSVPADKRENAYNFSIVKVKGDTITVEVYSFNVHTQAKLIDKFQKQSDQWQNLPTN
ncbi:MAG: metallophosphoesterase [Planctomycetota bacterium]